MVLMGECRRVDKTRDFMCLSASGMQRLA